LKDLEWFSMMMAVNSRVQEKRQRMNDDHIILDEMVLRRVEQLKVNEDYDEVGI
jgi:hypothetical protein